uniref:Nucleoside diphosphate kinase, mitochondrial n=1 Tax=Sciurus vulgaris TaxID=55149 RepID=A0A8D2CZG8_SCIVU
MNVILSGKRVFADVIKNLECTLVAVKPDGMQWWLIGAVTQHFEMWGFKLVDTKMLQAPESILAEHYQDLQRKPFYPTLISYMSCGPVVAMEGHSWQRDWYG